MKTVLLAAGFGSRLWPLSTSDKPKQFQPLLGGQSLLQYTYKLFRSFTQVEELYVLTLHGLEHWVYEQLPGIPKANVLIVPERRNTLPHTLFALNTLTHSPEEQVLCGNVDLVVTDPQAFCTSAKSLAGTKDASKITMLFSAEGVIDPNASYAKLDRKNRVTEFYEKPDRQTIEKMLELGPFYKNTGGVVALSVSSLQIALEAIDKNISAKARKLLTAMSEPNRIKTFLDMPFCDIDTTVFQEAPNIVGHLTLSDFIDLGKFSALHHVNDKDERGNVIIGNIIVGDDCTNNFLVNQLMKPLVIITTNNMVVAQTAHGTLVAPLDEADRIGAIYKEQIHPRASQS